jgi:hypothetical protein
MRNTLHLATAAVLLISWGAFGAQTPSGAIANFADNDKSMKGKPDVTYGRVKEITAGQKVVIDVDNAMDKSFDLTDKDVAVKLAPGLKVGDPVKVTEHSVAGKTKRVEITHHAGGGVSHGDKKSAAAEKK